MSAERKEREFDFKTQDFKFLAQLVHDKTGIVLGEHKRDMVYSRLARRLRALNMRTFTHYCDLIQTPEGEAEMSNLVNAITTNLTSFFREKHHFEHLRQDVLEPLMKSNSASKRVRIWSAGCSSGAEPYSIAMVAAELMEKYRGWDVRILATDIDTNMLARGASGKYRLVDLEDILPRYRKFTTPTKREGEDGIMMNGELRQMITFNRLNLLESWPIKGPFDAIFCRNVVIYFDKPTQKKLFDRYAALLKPDAWLYIGHSENLFQVCDRFKLKGKTIYQRAS